MIIDELLIITIKHLLVISSVEFRLATWKVWFIEWYFTNSVCWVI